MKSLCVESPGRRCSTDGNGHDDLLPFQGLKKKSLVQEGKVNSLITKLEGGLEFEPGGGLTPTSCTSETTVPPPMMPRGSPPEDRYHWGTSLMLLAHQLHTTCFHGFNPLCIPTILKSLLECSLACKTQHVSNLVFPNKAYSLQPPIFPPRTIPALLHTYAEAGSLEIT